jgi:antitoxin (DNA-binding transcriptional repressor) of toxin-antitoxin stability system
MIIWATAPKDLTPLRRTGLQANSLWTDVSFDKRRELLNLWTCPIPLDKLYNRVYSCVQIELGGLQVKTVTFTEFRKHASELFSEVEGGEAILVLRHGMPIAEICPASTRPSAKPSWKRPGLRLTAKGARLSSAILEERRHEDVL